jgi:hypothetical protein
VNMHLNYGIYDAYIVSFDLRTRFLLFSSLATPRSAVLLPVGSPAFHTFSSKKIWLSQFDVVIPVLNIIKTAQGQAGDINEYDFHHIIR